jgi:hypothetical protein
MFESFSERRAHVHSWTLKETRSVSLAKGLRNFEFTLSTAERNLRRTEEMIRPEKSQDYRDLYWG